MADRPLYDVLVVGYGPSGQVLAAQLGQQGHHVLVLERSPEPYPLPRAGHVDDEVVRVFQSVGAADRFEERAVTPRGYEWLSASGELLFMIDWNRATKSTWRSDYIFYQPYVEEAITEAVDRQQSVTVRRGWAVTSLVDHGSHLTVTAQEGSRETGQWQPTGVEESFDALYAVGADGANSVVRAEAGVAFEDFGFEETLSIVDLRLNDPDMDISMPDAGQICDPARPISLFRWLGREHCRWEFMLMPGEDPDELVSESGSWDKLARWGVTPENATMIRRTLYTFNSLITETFRQRRVLLVGDAAHLMPPFLGQGMCTGIRDVTNVAWKLDLVLRGVADDRLLDSYTVERRPHVQVITEIAIALGKVLCEIDPLAAAARDAALLSGHTPPAPPLPGLVAGILHRDAAGQLIGDTGELSIQGRVTLNGHTGRFDDIVGRGWVLLSRKHGVLDRLSEASRSTMDRLGAIVAHVTKATMPEDSHSVVDRDGGYAAWFARLGADVILVRPDFYTFGAATEAGADVLIAQLADQLALV